MSRAILRTVALAGLAMVLTSDYGASQSVVRVQWERETDFERFESFGWLNGTHAADRDAHRFIVQTIENQLGIRGLFEDENEPDVYIAYHGSSEEKFEISSGHRKDWKSDGAIIVNRYVAGTLVVDLVDPAARQLIWRATALSTFEATPNATYRHKLRDDVAKMFAQFPPTP